MQPTATDERRLKSINLIWVGLVFAIFYWVLESVRDVLAFDRGTLIERLFFPDLASVWLRLLIISMIILYGSYAQSLRGRVQDGEGDERPGGQIRVIVSGLVFAALYWILETIRDTYVFRKGELLDQLLRPDVAGLSVRLLAVSVLVLFSIYVQNLINERRASEEAVRKNRELLEKQVDEKTAELRKANEQLKEVMEGRRRLENALWVSRKSLNDIANAIPDAIVILDRDHRVRFANMAFQELIGRHTDSILGEVFTLPLKPGERGRVRFNGTRGAREVNMRVGTTEWQEATAFLVVLQPVAEPDFGHSTIF
jgi:PAS domain-containing protein